MPEADSRGLAAEIIAIVIKEGITLDSVFHEFLPTAMEPREQAFIKELSYGVLRWYFRLDFILEKLLKKPLRRKDTDIRTLILCGLYQMVFLRTPSHAAISATVEGVMHLNKDWGKPLVNAVLREYQRESEGIQEMVRGSDIAYYAHPEWFIDAVRDEWPEYWENILEANNQRPPMFLRVNLLKNDRDSYLKKLRAANINAIQAPDIDCAIKLIEPVNVEELPGFSEGLVSVQDPGAQRAAGLLDLKPGHRVLDACAAPGGKTAHIYETEPSLEGLTAVDIDSARLEKVGETAKRLEIKMEIVHADVCDSEHWWNHVSYDRILLDAPCSATGVIRRHPDIKVLRDADMLMHYRELQRKLLESVWSMLKTRGKLVYATCSILSGENDGQIETFIENHRDAGVIKITAPWGISTDYGLQTLPGIGDSDGFYYAVLEKH